jgi:hypothetical protein
MSYEPQVAVTLAHPRNDFRKRFETYSVSTCPAAGGARDGSTDQDDPALPDLHAGKSD